MHKIYELEASINSIVLQMIAGVGKLRVSASETNAFSHWAQLFASWIKIRLKLQSIQNAATVVNAILPSLTTTVIFTFMIFFMEVLRLLLLRKSHFGFFGILYCFYAFILSDVQYRIYALYSIPYLGPLEEGLSDFRDRTEEVKKGHAFEELTGRFALDKVFFRYSPQSAVHQ
jgi:ABC-type bacteriocin/lantibiotic exporter with double-glycine peptidase domain